MGLGWMDHVVPVAVEGLPLDVDPLEFSIGHRSSRQPTLSPVQGVLAIRLTMPSWLVRGQPRQF